MLLIIFIAIAAGGLVLGHYLEKDREKTHMNAASSGTPRSIQR